MKLREGSRFVTCDLTEKLNRGRFDALISILCIKSNEFLQFEILMMQTLGFKISCFVGIFLGAAKRKGSREEYLQVDDAAAATNWRRLEMMQPWWLCSFCAPRLLYLLL